MWRIKLFHSFVRTHINYLYNLMQRGRLNAFVSERFGKSAPWKSSATFPADEPQLRHYLVIKKHGNGYLFRGMGGIKHEPFS